MKHLIYLLLFSTAVFSQNYNYAVKKNQKNTLPIVTTVNNQLEEIEYFKAYLLPIAEKANLQTALDTYGSVRLGAGDYSGVDIVMKSNQRLYGHPSLTKVSNITIAAGSSNVYLSNLFMNSNQIIFQAGTPITNCTLKTIKWATITATNAKIENNIFINIMSQINFNCSTSGYIRNNKIYKHQVQGPSPALTLKGNSTTPSYGNVNVFSNYLTPLSTGAELDNIAGINFIGLDSEGWNLSKTSTKAMLTASNMGNIKITDFGGGNGYAPGYETPAFDIQANNLFFLNKGIGSSVATTNPSKARANTNVFLVSGLDDDEYDVEGTGFDFRTHFFDDDHSTYNNFTPYYNKMAQSSTIVDSGILSNITSAILDIQHPPIARPTFETLPDPLGSTWKTDRGGKTDSTSYIQNLINTKGIAELPEGIFYISSTLSMIVDGTKGIVGAGTGKTVIVGLTDTFPLISLVESANGDNNFLLSNLTLQGGSIGVFAPDAIDMIAFTNMNYVVFRNQNYGIQLYRIFGFDNCFFDHVSFVNCNVGFFQDPDPVYTFANAGYIDKTLFYQAQFINCGIATSMYATRADNLNVWIDCKFMGNNLAVGMAGNNYPIFANCDFTNNHGEYTIDGEMSMYNCNFSGNSVSNSTFRSKNMYIEGCNFLDSSRMFVNSIHYAASFYILNSKITGDVTKTYGMTQAVYVNSSLLANPTLSKLFVNVKDNIPTVLINTTPNPYPQFLVTQ
jgi:hypothetical protein